MFFIIILYFHLFFVILEPPETPKRGAPIHFFSLLGSWAGFRAVLGNSWGLRGRQSAQDAPMSPQDLPESPQDLPNRLPGPPQSLQNAHPDVPKEPPQSNPKEHQNRNWKITFDSVWIWFWGGYYFISIRFHNLLILARRDARSE